jgi:hypothetical protein
MSKNHADSVQQNGQEPTEESREIGEEALAEEVLAKVAGAGERGIIKVLNHPAYITAHTLGAAPPHGIPKPVAIKPLLYAIAQEPERTTVVYGDASGVSQVQVNTPNPGPVPRHR